MDKVSFYRECIYKEAEDMNKKNNEESVLLNSAKGAIGGTLGSAALLGGGAAALGKGIASKGLKEGASGALGAFNPAEVSSAFKDVKKFRNAGTIGKFHQGLFNGNKIARGYGTMLGVGAGAIGAGIGAATALKKNDDLKKAHENATSVKLAMESITEQYRAEKTAGIGTLFSSFAAKSLGQKAAIGAGIGAGVGALTSKPTLDENGNLKSNRISGALTGALTGGLTGAMIKSPKSNVGATKSSASAVTGSAATATQSSNSVTNAIKQPKTVSDYAKMNTRNINFNGTRPPVNKFNFKTAGSIEDIYILKYGK